MSEEEIDLKRKARLSAAFEDAVDEMGFSVEGYEILGELDRGGMGVVYHALQLTPEREVALKILLPKYGAEKDMRERFQTEAKAMAALEHPGILPIYEVGESGGLPFFSMKLASGGTLAHKLREGRIPVKTTVGWMHEIADAVSYAHQHGVLHRDLKPGNFLFDDADRLYVADFGVAKMLTNSDAHLTQTNALIGTPYYMAPETASGDAKVPTVAADLYSIGAVFYECLTGDKSHAEHENVASLLRAISDEPVAPPRKILKSIPLDLSLICHKALEHKPEKRYSSVASFSDDLKRWEERKPIRARPVGVIERVWRWAVRYPLPAALSLAMILTLAIGGLLLIFSYRERGVAMANAERRLHETLIAHAHNERILAAPGHRERVFDLLGQAFNIAPSERIREEMIAVLAKMDVSRDDDAVLLDDSDDVDVARYTLVNGDAAVRGLLTGDENWLLTFHVSGQAVLWNVEKETLKVRSWEAAPGLEILAEFTQAGDGLYVADSQHGSFFYSGDRFQEERHIPVDDRVNFIALKPSGSHVVSGGTRGLSVKNLNGEENEWESYVGTVRCPPCWSSDGEFLVAALGEIKQISVYKGDTGKLVFQRRLGGWPEQIQVDPKGRFVAAVCDDGLLYLLDLQAGRVLMEMRHRNERLVRFSQDSNHLWLPKGDEGWEAWKLHDAVGYREWRNHAFSTASTTVFGAKLSLDGKFLLTISTGGIEIWDTESGRRTSGYESDNQRIDAKTDAWWLPGEDLQVIVQVPGALEKLILSAQGDISEMKSVERVPGVSIVEIDSNNTWKVRVIDEDDEVHWENWPGGDFLEAEEIMPLPEVDLLCAKSFGTEALVVKDREIRLNGKRSYSLVLPDAAIIRQILFSPDGNRLYGVSQDYRVFDWDLSALDDKLRALGFETNEGDE